MSQDVIRCFFLEPTDQVENTLRRFYGFNKTDGRCRGKMGFHNADVVIGRGHALEAPEIHDGHPVHGDVWAHDDVRWPKACECGYVFTDEDEWQFNPHALFRRSDDGGLVTLQAAPVGAMWFAPWFSDSPEWHGPDGQTLVVRVPGPHDWIVDGRASNCGLPRDNVHKCWVRHGMPPDITVDKNGNTCPAGAGSIAAPNWHGFLDKGYLVLNR